ncbi:hypothetical protein QBC38DRAFT_531145 [Podospora fimiseda]|uniref:Uncharacterized protein n=1 Tax=Podospora fimiseda TaxID=252190 RepID=A0AAN7BL86_9PEZI|nr:hypothetical protein QBC38DRAFT_531145 [Podospora fimiseda]
MSSTKGPHDITTPGTPATAESSAKKQKVGAATTPIPASIMGVEHIAQALPAEDSRHVLANLLSDKEAKWLVAQIGVALPAKKFRRATQYLSMRYDQLHASKSNQVVADASQPPSVRSASQAPQYANTQSQPIANQSQPSRAFISNDTLEMELKTQARIFHKFGIFKGVTLAYEVFMESKKGASTTLEALPVALPSDSESDDNQVVEGEGEDGETGESEIAKTL